MKNYLIVKSKQNKRENNKIKEANDISYKMTKKRKIKPLINNNITLNIPLIYKKNDNKYKFNQQMTNNNTNIKEETFQIKLHKNIYSSKKKTSENKNIISFSERKAKNYNKKEINLKNMTFNSMKKKHHNEIAIRNILGNHIFFKRLKISKNNINQPKGDINAKHNNYTTKNSINKSRTRTLFNKNNFNFLNSTDYSSSTTKNTFLINKKNITRENSITNNNKTVLSEIKKINKAKNKSINKKIDLNKYFQFKAIKNKSFYNSTRHSQKNIINIKEYHYKNLKKYNNLLKEINSIQYNHNNHNVINRNKSINNNIINIDNNSLIKNKNKFYPKLSYTSRKQCKLKKLFFSHKEHSFEVKSELNAHLDINNYNNKYDNNENKEMNKIKILIKSNWGIYPK